jgi:Immunity protein 8
MRLQIKQFFSAELDKPNTPDDPECCYVHMYVDIGQKGAKGTNQFSFSVVTTKFLVENPETRWGKGYLLMAEFSWQEIERMLERLVSSISADSFEDAAKKLGNYLEWEFENYQPYKG